ncbi:MAG: PEP-CTERM sorting domain-containing protein [Candidatus Competibacteraceae bacterium]
MKKLYIAQMLSGFNLLLRLIWVGTFYIIIKGNNRSIGHHRQYHQCPVRTIGRLRVGLTLGSICALALSMPARAVSFTGLGDTSQANGVSADGSTVVGSRSSAQGTEAFKWTEQAGILGLGDLTGGTFSSTASAVSADGSVIVGSSSSAQGTEAFTWSTGTGMVGLAGKLPEGRSYSEATGVSANGTVIVGTSYPDRYGQFATFRLDQGAGVKDLKPETHASGVSADGSAVVGWSEAHIDRAFRWPEDNGMVILDDRPLDGPAWPASRAFGISDDGTVVVGASNFEDGLGAFRWSQAAGMISLGDLPGGEFHSEALDASADGSVIVGLSNSEAGQEALVWDQYYGMRSLLDLLVTAGVDLTGWVLSAATAISADGLTVVGNGLNPYGRQEAWIARLDLSMIRAVPEIDAAGAPVALATLIGGLLLIGEKSRRSRSWRGRSRN